ncbi:MAG: PaaI family thioesterase [Kiritimatiellia bacterium]
MTSSDIISRYLAALKANLGGNLGSLNYPPPVFAAMKGEMLDFDLEQGTLTNRFPVLQEYLNPYNSLQGGIISTLLDDTIGPLSLLVAPANFTRNLEVKFRKTVTPDLGFVIVTAKFTGRDGRQLFFEAEMKSNDGIIRAQAKAMHWIIG